MAYARNNMELVLKFYTDKPSRIGIKYAYEFEAIRAYEALMDKYRGETFILKLEPARDKINLTIQSEQSGGRVLYKDLDYRPDQLKKLELFFKNAEHPMLFVHIYSDSNMLFVAKPFRRQEFLTISGYEFNGSDSFH